MVRQAFLMVAGISAALVASAPSVNAQQSSPRIRVVSQPYANFGTIEPSISLNEASYVLAVAIDRDGQVSVLSPVLPSDIMRFEPSRSIRLPGFFSGFSTARSGYYGGYRNYHSVGLMRHPSEDYSAGSVLVIASRTPMNFAAISDGPFWNEEAIEKLVRYRDPSSGVYALGKAVTAKGQSFGHDYLRFSAHRYTQFANADPCSGFGEYSPYGYANYSGLYGYAGASIGRGIVIVQPTALSQGLQLVSIGTDGCGRTRFVVMPIRILPPREPADTVTVPEQGKAAFKSASAGTYFGDDARRVFEMVKNKNSSETYYGTGSIPVLKEEEDGPIGRPAGRDNAPDRAEAFERIKGASAQPIERAPVLRQSEPQRRESTPINREPIVRSEPVRSSPPPVQRELKPTEVVLSLIHI